MSEIVMEKATRIADETTIKERMQDILLDISWRTLAADTSASLPPGYITSWTASTAVTTQALPPESKLSAKGLYMTWLTESEDVPTPYREGRRLSNHT